MWVQGSEGWDLDFQPQDQESQAMGSGSADFLRGQGSDYTMFVGSGTKICRDFGIKDKTYLVMTLYKMLG